MPDMSTYLSAKAADYSTTVLSVTPQGIITEESVKNQVVYEMDDAELYVVNLSASYFKVTLEWTYLSDAGTDAETILDFWNDSSKGNFSARTFYWQHPKDKDGAGDPRVYTVRFLTPLKRVWDRKRPNGSSVLQVVLRVEGIKP